MSAEVARVLREAADLIEPPGRWTTGTAARTATGRPTWPTDPRAVCWCALGAICRAARGDGDRERVALDTLRQALPDDLIGRWNDVQPGPELVVAALRAVADEAEAS